MGALMRSAVNELVKLGPLPSSVNPDMARLESFQTLLAKIEQPISDDEARALVTLFGPDDCYGLAWTLVHVIETAPGWPLRDVLTGTGNEWIDRLKQRAGT
jgi:hypothetical protein